MCSETSEAVGTTREHAHLDFQKFLKIRIPLPPHPLKRKCIETRTYTPLGKVSECQKYKFKKCNKWKYNCQGIQIQKKNKYKKTKTKAPPPGMAPPPTIHWWDERECQKASSFISTLLQPTISITTDNQLQMHTSKHLQSICITSPEYFYNISRVFL